jgi:hypothetical protein
MAAAEQFVADEATDETGPAGDQDGLAHAVLIRINDRTGVVVSVRGIRRPPLFHERVLERWNEGSSSLFLMG